jgi:transposase-like protein
VPKPYPREFRDDVVRVAQSRDAGVTVEQIAKDFGVHPMTLFKLLRAADVHAGVKLGVSGSESAELRQARKRIKLLVKSSTRPRPYLPPRSAFAGFRFPPDVIVVAVRWYLRFNPPTATSRTRWSSAAGRSITSPCSEVRSTDRTVAGAARVFR